jgi:hypothetical protein
MPRKTPVKKNTGKRKAAPKTDAPAPLPKRGRGRPPVEFRKRSFHLLLDPRYIEYWRKKCDEMNVPAQDLARMAMNAVIPDPYNLTNVREIERFLDRLNPK